MVFFVYLDPPVFSAAAKAGPLGLDALAAVLRGFLQNCVLLDFDDWRWETGVRQALSTHERTFENSLVKKLLVQLKKRDRIEPCFRDDYSGKTEMNLVLAQANEAELDLILADSHVAHPNGGQFEIAKLEDYQQTAFEAKRSEAAANGREYSGGELAEGDFLIANFRKALKFATRIDICDAVFGRSFADNYEHTLRLLLGFLDGELVERETCELTIHCEQSARSHHLLTQLAKHRPLGLSKLKITVIFYIRPPSAQCLPHERYLATNQFGFEIGRGMDFLDGGTGRNRDVSINLKDADVIRDKLIPFRSFSAPAQIVA
jgi:hypothetical protein